MHVFTFTYLTLAFPMLIALLSRHTVLPCNFKWQASRMPFPKHVLIVELLFGA